MEFYSKSKPNLIVPEMKQTVHRIIKNNSGNQTVSEKISDMMYKFYTDYIQEHYFLVIVLSFMVIFLLYRYYNKNENENETSTDEFNPLIEISEQEMDPLLEPTPVPALKKEQNYPYLINNSFTYPVDVYTPKRSYYSQAYIPPYDTTYINEFGYVDDSDRGVNMLDVANRNNIVDYQQILDEMRGNLTNSLRIGPEYLNEHDPEYTMDPPYAK